MLKLETARLIIEEAKPTDKEFIFELLNSPNWLRHIGDRGIRSLDDALEYIESAILKSYADNGFGLYKVSLKENNVPIGLCGLLKRPVFDHPDIGFAVLAQFEGKDFVYEAAQSILEYSQHQLKIETILAITTTVNSRSQNLLNRLGLKMVGLVEYNAKGDFLLYSTKAKAHIGKAKVEDLGQLNSIIWEAKKHWGYPAEWMEKWRSELSLTSADFVDQQLYTINKEGIMGLCGIKENELNYEVTHLWIHPKYMNQGLGKQLLNTAIALSALEAKPIIVESDPNAEDFYRAQGFVTYDNKSSQIEGRFLPLMKRENELIH